MNASAKDTVYIDIDDEITAIIEKVQSSSSKVVALVLPKRAAVLQSIVNMKLLKRAGEEAKKNIVLITSESNLLPLAGAVGLHVAKTLQSKPAIPPAPKTTSHADDVDDEAEIDSGEPLDKDKPVAAYAGDAEETIEVDNDDKADVAAAKGKDKKKLNKKLKVPNFNKFRNKFFLGGVALFLLILFWVMAAVVWPKANVTIVTDSTNLDGNITFTTKSDLAEVDLENKVVPSVIKEVRTTDTEKAAATGQKDMGTKATGTVTFTNCTDDAVTIPVNTTVAANGLNFLTQKSVSLDEGDFTSGGVCKSSGDHVGSSGVVAQNNGEQYNLSSRAYVVSGVSSNVKAQGTDMTGGTTKIVKVVSQADVDGAKQKLAERTSQSVDQDLEDQLREDGFFVIPDSVVTDTPTVTSSPEVDQEATEVTITSTVVSTMIGVKEDDLKKLIEHSMQDQITASGQKVQDHGLGSAIFRINEKQADGSSNISLQTIVVVGPQLDQEAIKREIAGKKRGETQSIIQGKTGVKEVRVDYSPFWVYSTPKKTGKITITIEQPTTDAASQ